MIPFELFQLGVIIFLAVKLIGALDRIEAMRKARDTAQARVQALEIENASLAATLAERPAPAKPRPQPPSPLDDQP